MQRNIAASALCAFVTFAGAGACPAAAEENTSAVPVVAATWEHRHANFTYYGITALYSGDGLEDNIRALLSHFGARKDLKVSARGCPRGSSVPGRTALVDVDFYSLVPSSDGGAAVRAQWAPVEVSSTHPYFMGHGDCELIDEMKDIISKNFSFRDLRYRTDCVPHQVNIDDFGIKAEALKPLPGAAANGSR